MERNLATAACGDRAQIKTSVFAVGGQGRTWRLDVTDPVYVALLGGSMAVESRTE